jgi:hypothetical protein
MRYDLGVHPDQFNGSWRPCHHLFVRWTQAGPEEVEISKHYE